MNRNNLLIRMYMSVKRTTSKEKLMAAKLDQIKCHWGNLTLSIPPLVKAEYIKSKCCPTPDLIFNAFNLCSLNAVRVVIIGQDPYPENKRGKAYGLAFMNNRIIDSLKNIKKELKEEGFELKSPDLTSWAKQGVLLMNTWLSVRKGKAASHRDLGWKETVTNNVIDKLISDPSPKVFLIWGQIARNLVNESFKRKKGKSLYNITKNQIPESEETQTIDDILYLYSAHPSNQSVNKGAKPKFIGNGHFKKANDFLSSHYKGLNIDWSTK